MDTATDDTQKEGTENALSNNTTNVPSNNAVSIFLFNNTKGFINRTLSDVGKLFTSFQVNYIVLRETY